MQRYWAWALVVLFAGLLWWVISASQGFQNCICNAKYGNAYQTAHESRSHLKIVLLCIGEFLEANNGAITALATIVMAIFTGTLWSVTGKAVRLAREEFQFTKKQLEEAGDVAGKQIAIQGMQTDIQEKQKEISRLEFFATHRPRIIMRNASVIKEDGAEKILYTLVNAGGSDATIKESWVLTEVVSSGQPIRNLRCAGHNDLGIVPLVAGQDRDFTYPLSGEISSAMRLSSDVYFTGSIRYCDPKGTMRTSVFRRRYEGETFRRTGDQDHEYSD